jgi:ribosome-binding factor A
MSRDSRRSEPFRHERIERAVLEELRSLLQAEVLDPALTGVWLVDVHLSPDGKHARVSYAVRGGADEAAIGRTSKAAFTRAAGFLRSRLAAGLNLKRTPQLSFVFIGLLLGESEARPDQQHQGLPEHRVEQRVVGDAQQREEAQGPQAGQPGG